MTKPTLSDALKEARTYAPTDVISYDTLDFIHPDLPSPLRLVSGLENISAKLESTAPKNAGQVVSFRGVPFTFKAPSQGVGPTPEAVLEISNAGSEISSVFDSIMHSFFPVKIIYRTYTNKTLLSGPQLTPPPTFQMVSASGGGVVRISLRAIDLTKMRFPKQLYDV